MILCGVALADVANSYIAYLEAHRPEALKKFLERLKASSDAAQAEAVVFSFLQWQGTNPTVAEDVSSGGADFLCRPSNCDPFYVEVSSIDAEATAHHSSWPAVVRDGISGGSFRLITDQLHRKIVKKADQLRNLPAAGVLALTNSHIGAMALMGRHAATCLMVSDYKISYRLGDDPNNFRNVTDLKRSVFFRPDKRRGEITACRRSVSAALLMSISDLMTSAVGLLHPNPLIPFAASALESVPMLSVTNWPERASGIKTAWSRRGGEHLYYYHEEVKK